MLGYAREALIGLPVHETLQHSHADGRSFPAETCPMLKAGRIVDISERKEIGRAHV